METMGRVRSAIAAGLVASCLAVAPAGAADGAADPLVHTPSVAAGNGSLATYSVGVDARALGALRAEGVDVHELAPSPGSTASAPQVDVVLSGEQADRLTNAGVDVEAQPSRSQADGDGVFRRYGRDDGLAAELAELAADHPGTTELVTLGRSVRGERIVALRVTKGARSLPDGARPASLFVAGQHAREWLSPEMVRRLAHHVVDGYGHDPTLTRLVQTTEMWFVPVANPDGYDFTFTPGNRLWRKNLRDNDGDGRITAVDGVDLNRNQATRWGHDDEGSSPAPSSETYRGPAPASEPETRALDRLMDRVDFAYLVNYHSAADDVYYGTGWQVSTPTPDDVVLEALVGDSAEPAVAGTAPGVIADLYTANGETTEHASVAHGALGVLVELSSCATASAADPDDRWLPADCPSAFTFPDDEALVEAEFRRQLPLALATARSAPDPDHPVSVTGRTAPDLVVDAFPVSYGTTQPVAVTARRDQHERRLNYRIDGGRTRSVQVREWDGGERYGDDHDTHYGEFRGRVTGARPGDRVEVWFSARTGRNGRTGGRHSGRPVESEHFTYTVAADADEAAGDDDVLIVASEDYKGVSPTYPAGTNGPLHADDYAAALDANDVDHATWDVDARGVPHPLGVLAHFDTVIWESGNDRLPQDPEDQLTDTFLFGPVPDIAVAERQQALTLAMRDHLNEGGQLIQAGETTQFTGLLGRSLGGIYYGLDGAPDQDCVVSVDFLADCLLLSDDFAQYYLGAADRAPFNRPTTFADQAGGPLSGVQATFGGPATVTNPLNEAGAFSLTPEPVAGRGRPPFAGELVGTYRGAGNADPFAPVEGQRYAGALPTVNSYQRIGRTVDLRSVPAADAPRLSMRLSYSTLQTFHHVIVEAAPAGTDQWTTLRDLNGRTSSGPPSACAVGTGLQFHPFLLHYLTPGQPACGRTGTTGAWNAFTGESGGWVDAAFDLSAYAGKQVDVKVAYVTDEIDNGTGGGIGVFVDDTRLTVGGQVVAGQSDGFEAAGPGLWSVEGPPAGSPALGEGRFALSPALIGLGAGVATDDTVLLGFGLESIASPGERATLLGRLLDHLDP